MTTNKPPTDKERIIAYLRADNDALRAKLADLEAELARAVTPDDHEAEERAKLQARIAELEEKPVLLARLAANASNPAVSDSAGIAAVTFHMQIVEQIEEQGRAILAAREKEKTDEPD